MLLQNSDLTNHSSYNIFKLFLDKISNFLFEYLLSTFFHIEFIYKFLKLKYISTELMDQIQSNILN